MTRVLNNDDLMSLYAVSYRKSIEAIDVSKLTMRESISAATSAFFAIADGKHPTLPGFDIRSLAYDPDGENYTHSPHVIESGKSSELYELHKAGQVPDIDDEGRLDYKFLDLVQSLEEEWNRISFQYGNDPTDEQKLETATSTGFSLCSLLDGSVLAYQGADLRTIAMTPEQAAARGAANLADIPVGEDFGVAMHEFFYDDESPDDPAVDNDPKI